jgi:hypothetical protein
LAEGLFVVAAAGLPLLVGGSGAEVGVLAGEGESVDVGGAVRRPFDEVMDFGVVSGLVAAWCGAAAVDGVQNDALIGGGQPFGAAEKQRPPTFFVVDVEVMMGVGGHPDRHFHRDGGSAAGQRQPGGGFQVLQGHGDDGGGR